MSESEKNFHSHEEEHEHFHEHEHTHGHDHHHDHDSLNTPGSKEECIALLKYMLNHNEHHAQELHELAHGVDGEPARLIHEAVHLLDHSNEKLEEALKLL